MPKRRNPPQGLEAFRGKPVVSWADISAATGLEVSTLRHYKANGKMPEGYTRNAWRADDKALRDWVLEKLEQGQGYRSDLYGTRETA